jgi:hypothetical protein
MLLGFGPFVFIVDQIATSTSISILMLLSSGPFFFVFDQVAITFLCPMGF